MLAAKKRPRADNVADGGRNQRVTRFMRRHGLVSRAVALVVLCQGLVMAWLAQTRQLLPPALRKRQRSSRGATLQAAHFASLSPSSQKHVMTPAKINSKMTL